MSEDMPPFMKMCPFYEENGVADSIIMFPLNIEELHNMSFNGILKDAKIFKYLFGFESAGENFKKIDENYVFDFSKYNITFGDWVLFIKFLKYEKVRICNKDKLMEICNKFGGIPAFDRWYQKEIDERKEKKVRFPYNPMTPGEDTKQLYNWRACNDLQIFSFGNQNDDYSIGGSERINDLTKTYFWKKLKTYTSFDRDEVEIRQVVLTNNTAEYDDMHDFREEVLDI